MKDKYPYNRINQQYGPSQVGGPSTSSTNADASDNLLKSAAKAGGVVSNATNQHHLIKYE